MNIAFMCYDMAISDIARREMINAWEGVAVDYNKSYHSGNIDIVKTWLNAKDRFDVVVLVGTEAAEGVIGEPFNRLGKLETFAGQLFKLPQFAVPVFPIYSPFYARTEEGATEFYRSVGAFGKAVIKPPILLQEFDSKALEDEPYMLHGVYGIDTEGTAKHPWCATVYPPSKFYKPEDKIDEIENGEGLVFHSALHDARVLKNWSDKTLNIIGDTMVAAYHLGLPLGLKELAARELGIVMTPYMDMIRGPLVQKLTEYFTKAASQDYPKPPAKKRSTQSKILNRLNKITSDNAPEVAKKWLGKEDRELREEVEKVIEPFEYPTLADVKPEEKARHYALLDPYATYRLHNLLLPRLRAIKAYDAYMLDVSLVPVIDRMQEVGVPVSEERVNELIEITSNEVEGLLLKLKGICGDDFNPASALDTVEALQEDGLELTKRTKGGNLAADKNVLKGLAGVSETAGLILKFREAFKLLNTYIPALTRFRQKDGRIHPVWRTTNTDTGRLSCSNPNLMAFPARSAIGKKFRDCFVAPEEWKFVNADLDQIELRLMAHESRDENMINVIKQGLDLHTATASTMFGIPYKEVVKNGPERFKAKIINFLMVYEGGAAKLQEGMAAEGIVEPKEYWQRLIDEWYKAYPGVREYQRKRHIEAQTRGFVQDMWGRIRHVEGVRSVNRGISAGIGRKAGNFPIQSGAQILVKRAMLRLWEIVKVDFAGDVELVLQIHDELVFLVRENRVKEFTELLVSAMTADGDRLRVPISASYGIGNNWGELK